MISRSRMERVAQKLITPMMDGYTGEFYGEHYPDRPGLTLWTFDPHCTCDTPFYLPRDTSDPRMADLLDLCEIPPGEPERAFEVVERMLGLR